MKQHTFRNCLGIADKKGRSERVARTPSNDVFIQARGASKVPRYVKEA